MILTKLSEPTFEYDVRGLLTSFYPGEEIRFLFGETDEDRTAAADAPGASDNAGIPDDAGARLTLKIRCDIAAGEGRILLAETGAETALVSEIAALPGDRQSLKRGLKRHLYYVLSEHTGRELPWGTLTGIRPTNIVLKMLEEGASGADCGEEMRETYLVGEEKTALSLEIASLEHEILDGLGIYGSAGTGTAESMGAAEDADPAGAEGDALVPYWSLYAGIPFCPTRCLYCSFATNPIDAWKGRIDRYLEALEREMDTVAEIFEEDAYTESRTLHTVYIGGGTPTSLSADERVRLLDSLERRFRITDRLAAGTLREFCVEAGRPDTVTAEKMRVLKDHGVTRISINPQSMKQRTLDLIGRRHTVEQVREAFLLARAEGFGHINMDIILGLPEETAEDVRRTCEEIAALGPEALTVHSLALKRASKLNLEEANRGYVPASVTDTEEMMRAAESIARGAGMRPYYLYRQKNMAGNLENVGFAKPGFEGIYNILMMEEKENIAAIGAGTISKAVSKSGKIERTDNVKDPALYLERLDEMTERKKRLFT